MRPNEITQECADRIWTILKEHAGAGEYWRGNFIACCTTIDNEHPAMEYRFQGDLGFGGKFRNYQDRGWYVDCYIEDETPDRKEIIKKTNEKLNELWREIHGKPQSKS